MKTIITGILAFILGVGITIAMDETPYTKQQMIFSCTWGYMDSLELNKKDKTYDKVTKFVDKSFERCNKHFYRKRK